jgi:hypothetical protein
MTTWPENGMEGGLGSSAKHLVPGNCIAHKAHKQRLQTEIECINQQLARPLNASINSLLAVTLQQLFYTSIGASNTFFRAALYLEIYTYITSTTVATVNISASYHSSMLSFNR